MSTSKIYGYRFVILVSKGDERFVATCPGIGGVFEEGNTENEALENALKAVKLILDIREENGIHIEKDNKYLQVIRKPIWDEEPIIAPKTLKKIPSNIDIKNYSHIPCPY